MNEAEKEEKKEILQVVVNRSEKELIEKAAASENRSVSNFLRHVTLEWINHFKTGEELQK